MSVQWEPREHSPYGRITDTTPVVDGRLWRGVGVGLLIVAPFWLGVARLMGWV